MKKTQLLLLTVVIVSMLFSTVYVKAVTDVNEDNTTPTEFFTEVTTESLGSSETEISTESNNDEDNFEVSDYEGVRPSPSPSRWNFSTTESKKPSKTTTEKVYDDEDNQNYVGGNNNNNNNDNNNYEEDVENTPTFTETEEVTLPEGHFYIYMERNNGQKRLKKEMSEPSLIAEPSAPVRKGFIFDGWYADSKFTKLWNFFTDVAQEGTVIYAKWVADPNAVVYKVTVNDVNGGRLEVNPDTASAGEPVIINIYPDEGMRLVSGSVTINGKSSDVLSFIMPAGDVIVDARFEVIPEKTVVQEDKTPVPFIIGGVVLLLAIICIVLFIRTRKDDYDDEQIDENGTIIDTDDDMSWVDETIVIEDGFRNGEKIEHTIVVDDEYMSDDADFDSEE